QLSTSWTMPPVPPPTAVAPPTTYLARRYRLQPNGSFALISAPLPRLATAIAGDSHNLTSEPNPVSSSVNSWNWQLVPPENASSTRNETRVSSPTAASPPGICVSITFVEILVPAPPAPTSCCVLNSVALSRMVMLVSPERFWPGAEAPGRATGRLS